MQIDNIPNNSTFNDDFTVSGWALNSSGAKSVSILVDGSFKGYALTGISRPDIKGNYPNYPNADTSGFDYTVGIWELSNGAHTVTAVVTGNDGSTAQHAVGFTVSKSNSGSIDMQLSITKSFFAGVWDAVTNNIQGVWELITNLNQIPGLVTFAINAADEGTEEHRLIKEMVISELIDLTIKYATGDANVRARMYGRAVGELIIALAGPKGITGALNVLKDLTKVMKLGDVIAKIGKGTKAAEVVALIDRIAETVSKIKNILKTNVQDIITYVKQIIKFDNYYEVVTPDGQVFKIMKDEIPVENISKINNISEGALKGLGKIAGNTYDISVDGLNRVKLHLAQFGDVPENSAMIKRLENALANGKKLEGADASFYLHELKEADLMKSGMDYDTAHDAALKFYEVSNFSVYHPDVIKSLPGEFNDNWFRFWGLK